MRQRQAERIGGVIPPRKSWGEERKIGDFLVSSCFVVPGVYFLLESSPTC